MSRRQWIWLLVAALVFAAVGAASVAVNTWSHASSAQVYADSVDKLTGLLGGGQQPVLFPEEEFIARVDIEGTIMSAGGSVADLAAGFDLDHVLDYIDALTDCPANAGILLYVDSGGGEMNASDEVYLKLMDYKEATGRPVYAYFDGTACSGAYYIAMAADSIWANRNCICVNIGVYIETYNLSALFEKYGVEEIMIKSSDNKGIGAIGQPWTDEQLAIYQSIVDLYYDQFLDVVSAGRGMTKQQVRTLDDGREMLASQALAAGFIDGIGRYEEYRDTVLDRFDGAELYEESFEEPDLYTLFSFLYSRIETLVPVSDAKLLRDFVDAQDGIVVMAYAK